jgi:hypothetical protein
MGRSTAHGVGATRLSRPFGRTRGARTLLLATAGFLAALSLPAPRVFAQEGEDGTSSSVPTTALMLLEGGATAGQGATVSIGLRRGLAEVAGIRFVHPVDVLSPPPFSEDLQMSIEELEPLADQVRDGDARDASDRADLLIEAFEANLESVRREQLIDAYMLAAVSRCRSRRTRECEALMERVVVFREGHTYDTTRYPAAFEDVFDRVRSRVTSGLRATLTVTTEPEGAEIYVDGRSYGPSPARVSGLLVGDHYVTIKHLGFDRTIRRATLAAGGSTVRYALAPNERSRLISSPEAQVGLRRELGEPRAGDSLRSLGNVVGAAQVLLGVVSPVGADAVHVQLWLYDVRTRFLLASREGSLSIDEAGMETARQLAVELYRGVSLDGSIAGPVDGGGGAPIERPAELWEQWWFWTAVGVVAVAAGVGIGVGTTVGDSQVPGGWTRLEGTLP